MELLIVTGHSSGLGKAIFEAAPGPQRVVLGVSRRLLSPSSPQQAESSIDLSSSEPWEETLTRTCRQWSHPWQRVILIHNAGTALPGGLIGALSPEAIASAFALNVLAPLRCSNWLLQQFPQTPLRLVFIGSGAAQTPYPGWSVYCASKAALLMQARVLAKEMEAASRPVKILDYAPGVIDTPMQASLRRLAPEHFPPGERLRALHENGQLVDARAAALSLLQLIDQEQESYFARFRYGDSQLSS